MGPAFALVFVAGLGLFTLALAYCVIGLFCARKLALAASVAFVAGAGGGAAVFLAASWLVVGSASLIYRWQVITYLASLALSAAIGGVLLAFYVGRALQRSNISSKRTPLRGAA